jgi:hypothetical protein
VSWVAATVMADGEMVHASTLKFPAATTCVTPRTVERATASLTAVLRPPWMLMFATDGPLRLLVTQSMPAMIPDQAPLPLQSRTRTATTFTLLATPHRVPPTVPATCVPWPLQSCPLPPKASNPTESRVPNCACVVRIPLSMMYTVIPTALSV